MGKSRRYGSVSLIKVRNARTSFIPKMASVMLVLLLMSTLPFIVQGNEDLEPVFRTSGTTNNAKLGWNITALKDIDGDGVTDYAIGAPGENRVYIFNGPWSSSTSLANPSWRITGPASSNFGWDISSLDDYTGDGRNELIIGSPGESKAYIFTGRAKVTGTISLLQTNAAITIIGATGDSLGHSVAGIDYENNNRIFAIVGAPRQLHTISELGGDYRTGAVYLVNISLALSEGRTSVTPESDKAYTASSGARLVYVIYGYDDNGWLGFTVENVGDINGDGIEDIGMGDPYYSPVTTVTWLEKGAYYVHYGKNLMFEIPEKYPSNLDGYIYGQVNRSRLGWSAGVIGDTSGGPGSGDELMVSAPFQNEGMVFLFFGSTALQRDLSQPGSFDENFSGEQPGDRFGWSIARSDIVGPTIPSISIGAPGYDNRTGGPVMAESGSVYSFWSWSSSNYASTAKAKFYGRAAGDNIGHSMSQVNFTEGTSFQQSVLVSAPNAGSSNTGDLEVVRRNQLPSLGVPTTSPPTGSATTLFDLGVTYKDLEGDVPETLTMYLYGDPTGLELKKTISLSRDPSDTKTIKEGVKFIAQSTLPNSITKAQPDGPLYIKVIAIALRGSRDPVSNAVKPISGPVVDGVKPSAVDNINWIKGTSVPVEERIPGTFKVSFEWPEENEGFQDIGSSGRVKMLQLRYVMGNATLTNQDWSTYKVYNNFTGAEIKNYLTRQELLLGIDNINDNPLAIKFLPRGFYTIAFRAIDEVGNWGNVSHSVSAQAYFRPLDIPDVCLEVDLQDYKGEDGEGDDGGALKVTFIPPNIQHVEDIGSYWVFVEQVGFTSVSDLKANDSDRQPDLIITPADEEGFYNHTANITMSKGADLEDGKTYFAAVVTVNKWGQYTDKITLSNGAKVINDKELPIPKIKDVFAVGLDNQKKIKITWTPTTLPRFVQYQVYGQNFFFNKVEQAYLLATITTASESELVVSEIGGLPINSRNLYSFAVLALDHNDDIDLELDGNNSIHGVHYIEPDGVPMPNPLGFSVNDIPADGGAALSLSWFPELGLDEFWQYRIYFDDKPIASVREMQPFTVIGNYKTGDLVITEFKGAPLIDGMMYYAAITLLDYNLEENYTLGPNNYDWAEPINQSDRTAPIVFPTDLRVVEGSITSKSFELAWSPVLKAQVMDFNNYLIRYSSLGKVGSVTQDQLENGTARIDGLTRGTEYNVNISVVDDNGNIGPSSLFITIETAGKEQPPVIINVSIMFNEVVHVIENDGGYFNISAGDIRDEVYLTVIVKDDYTKSKFYYAWNITPPKGASTEKNGPDYYQFALELPKDQIGEYELRVRARDEAGLWSEEFTFKIKVTEVEEDVEIIGPIIIVAFILILLAAAGVVVFMLMSGKSSQQKQMVEQYEERRKDIETMDTIFTDLPVWTCSCGTTRIQIIENANCPSCFESHEAVPIDQMDAYLRDHDLVIKEMRIEVPSGWQGQDMAKDRAKKDLEDRKKRSLSALNDEFALYLKGTKYEDEIKPPVQGEGVPEEPGKKASLYHEGAIIPGQAPPTGPVQPTAGPHPPMMMMPMPGRPGMPPGVPPGQPMPMRPMIPPQPMRPPQQPQK